MKLSSKCACIIKCMHVPSVGTFVYTDDCTKSAPVSKVVSQHPYFLSHSSLLVVSLHQLLLP